MTTLLINLLFLIYLFYPLPAQFTQISLFFSMFNFHLTCTRNLARTSTIEAPGVRNPDASGGGRIGGNKYGSTHRRQRGVLPVGEWH